MAKSKKPAGEIEVTMDRRRGPRRTEEDSQPTAGEAPKTGRRKVPRRRQIDPTTCERDYSDEEIEFMQALDAYKRSSGRMFPTCSEVLEVVRGLGYERVSQPVEAAQGTDDEDCTLATALIGESENADADTAPDCILTATDDWDD